MARKLKRAGGRRSEEPSQYRNVMMKKKKKKKKKRWRAELKIPNSSSIFLLNSKTQIAVSSEFLELKFS
jgi:hypothetical protein